MSGVTRPTGFPVFSRNFHVDYHQVEPDLWRIISHLQDHVHDIVVSLDISSPDMVIRDAAVEFVRYPLPGCLDFVDKMKQLVGADLFTDFRQKLAQLLGPQGCPNAANLVSAAAPALVFFYFPDLISRGKLKEEEWWDMVHTKLAGNCIAH